MVAAIRPAGTTLTYYPLGAARDLIRSRDPEVLIEGPAGTGKTLAACHKVHLTARKYPGVRILMIRKELESLKTGALDTYQKSVRPTLDGARPYGGSKFLPGQFEYPNGSVVIPGGLNKAEKTLSAEYDLIYVNEGTELTENEFEMLTRALRSGVMPYQQIIVDCNPSGPKHWLKARCDRGQTRHLVSVHQDNPAYWDRRRDDWTAKGLAYVQGTLANMTGLRRKRLFLGQWAAAEGLVYDGFTPEMVQTVDTEGWRTALGVDVGARNPTAILTCHIAGDGRWHIGREFYRGEQTATDILAAVRSAADRDRPERIYIDPSAKAYIDQLHREHYPAVKAVNDILVGIQRVQAVVRDGFTIDPSCRNTIEEFGMYAYPEGSRADADKPVDDFNHALDGLRYAVMGESTPKRRFSIV